MSTIAMLSMPPISTNYKNSMPSMSARYAFGKHNGLANNRGEERGVDSSGSNHNNGSLHIKMTSLPIMSRGRAERLMNSIKLANSLPDLSSIDDDKTCPASVTEDISFGNSPPSFFPNSLPTKFDLEQFMLPLMMQNLTNLKKAQTDRGEERKQEAEVVPSPAQTQPEPQPCPQQQRRRKNSSMTPVVPDLQLMAKLQAEDDKKAAADAVVVDDDAKTTEGHSERVPLLSRCDSCSEKETATAWLAAATTQLTPRLLGKASQASSPAAAAASTTAKFAYGQCNLQYKNGNTGAWDRYVCTPSPPASMVSSSSSSATTQSPKTLQPFQEDRVRRTSILRQSSPFSASTINNDNNNAVKKKVSFADSCGHRLESIRYIAPNSQAVHRRYSSNTTPTFISPWNYGGNNPWASPAAITKSQTKPEEATGLRRSIGVCNISAAATPNVTPVVNVGAAEAFGTPQQLHNTPRCELVATNFTSPSLLFNFLSKVQEKSVLLHSLTTAETTIYGIVSVANRHFTKRITVRYSFNEWNTYIEREGTYMLGSHDGRTDKFSFVIYARPSDFTSSPESSPSLPDYFSNLGASSNRLSFAIRFMTGDEQEYWDNNEGNNYCLALKTH